MSAASAPAKPQGDPPTDIWVGGWLLLVCACVLAMVLVGGATRLTDSGLSITEWDLGKGLTPPLTAERWAEEFALYQRTNEYQLQNRGMGLAAFQSIYWWEWAHRFIGKLIGLLFAAPFLFFLLRGRLKGRIAAVASLFGLGALQGFVGWWMVTSGLFSGLDVSPLRLAIHLALALAILAWAFWLALAELGWPRRSGSLGAPHWAPFALLALIFAQAMLGALLAGSDGGPAFADWPAIGGELMPASAFSLQPLWRNLIENHAAQHLLHRNLGYVVALVAFALAATALRRGRGDGRRVGLVVATVAVLQVGLGIATVVAATPLPLALAHQFGAAALWLSATAAARLAV